MHYWLKLVKILILFTLTYMLITLLLSILAWKKSPRGNVFRNHRASNSNMHSFGAFNLPLKQKTRSFEANVNSFQAQRLEATARYDHYLEPSFALHGSFKTAKPGFLRGSIEKNCTFIIGITTVKRENTDYLIETMDSLNRNSGRNKKKFSFLIYIGENDQEYLRNRTIQIQSHFADLISSNRLQIIGPPHNYYPKNWTAVLKSNFGDKISRVKWRSKQNLDQIFLMMNVYNLSPKYYLMMEDDVIARPLYTETIMNETQKQKENSWFILSFCALGAIGKLFKTQSLPAVASFLHLFWNKKPLDWLLDDFASSMYCSYDKSVKACRLRKMQMMKAIKPSLFQHIGRYSSLRGKIQKLRDSSFRVKKKKKRK